MGGRPWLEMGGGHRSLPGAAEGWTKEKSPGTAGLVPHHSGLGPVAADGEVYMFFQIPTLFFFPVCKNHTIQMSDLLN